MCAHDKIFKVFATIIITIFFHWFSLVLCGKSVHVLVNKGRQRSVHAHVKHLSCGRKQPTAVQPLPHCAAIIIIIRTIRMNHKQQQNDSASETTVTIVTFTHSTFKNTSHSCVENNELSIKPCGPTGDIML